jgi:hypothetical protein
VNDIRQGGEHAEASGVELPRLAEQRGVYVAQFKG